MEATLLVTREVNCSNLSKEDFVKFMAEDLNGAREEHKKIFYPKDKERHDNWWSNYRKTWEKRARTFAEKKWKRIANQDKYVDSQMEEFDKKDKTFKFDGITFFDIDLDPGRNGISGACSMHCDKVNENAIGACYECIKNNKYFKSGLGWKLIDYRHSRPQIELILPEDMQKMYEKEEKDLEDDIRRFYANTTYFGD